MKTVVLGSAGQLGRDLGPRLSGEVVPLTRERIDLARPDTIRPALEELRPDVVVNCAAYNFVDKAENEPDAACAVNAWGVRALAVVCRDLGCVLAHFSTDYVFGLDETRRTPCREDEAPGPVSVYGLSKLAGEYLVRSICPKHFVLRTCGLYGVWGSGGKGGNFVETMLRLAGQGRPLRVVADQFCTPTFTQDLADAAVKLFTAKQQGLWHLTNAGSCSWYEFAQAIFEEAGRTVDLQPITSAQYGAAARRPAYSVLGTIHNGGSPSIELRPWRQALADYLRKRAERT
jgi:dTDP-4-dehydrorhamnose reductase